MDIFTRSDRQVVVYVWMVEGIWENGEEFKLHGDVTLSGMIYGNLAGILTLYCCDEIEDLH